MIKLAIILLLFGGLALLVGSYLGPDDLKQCSERPGGSGQCRAADVIVAVSGGDTAARTYEAVRLYKNGWAPKLVFSGAALDENSPSNAAVMREIAIADGVPASAILIDELGRTTKQNAKETALLLRDEAISSAIIVTSGYHQRRTGLEFQQVIGAVELRNHPVPSDSQWSRWWWLTPNGWSLAVGELLRIVMFYVGVTR